MSDRRRWVLRVVGFLLLLTLADVTGSWLRISFWTPFENDPGLNVYVYQRERRAADILFLGSSKINTAIIPAVVEGELLTELGQRFTTFCLGQPGSSTLTSWLVLKAVAGSNGDPRVVVLELSPSSLNAHHGDIPRALRYYCSLSDLVWAMPWTTSWSRLVAAPGGAIRGRATGALYATRGLYWSAVSSRLATIARKRGAQFRQNGSWQHKRLSDLTDDQLRSLVRDARAWGMQQYYGQFDIGGAPEAAFRSICRFTKERGIRLIVLDPPVASPYRREASTVDEMLTYRRYLDGTTSTWDLEWVDIDADLLGLTDADFLNLTHLHPDGAEKYSRHLARTVLAPLLASPASESDGAPTG
jgi:hypothetical protein